MERILIGVILAIGAVFVTLTLVIVANKAWRETVSRYRERRRRVLEPVVLEFVHGEESSLVEALSGRVPPRDRAVLELILLDHVQRVRGIERERLGRALEQVGLIDEYLEGLESHRWWKRADAAEKLGLAGARRATDHLVRALDDDEPDVRMRAAKALGAIGGTASVRPLVRALNEPTRWSTIRIADILTSMGGEVVDELTALFPELSVPGKVAALEILTRLRPLRSVNWLTLRLSDPETDVRARACHALGSIGHPASGPPLVDRLQDPEWPVRAMAAKALGRVRYMLAIPDLCVALRDREWWPRANAAEALRAMGEPGIEALERMLDDDDNYARHQAVLMLEQSGVIDRRVDQLAGARDSERHAAEQWLARLVRVGQTGRLRELSAAHPDALVRQTLQRLLPPEDVSREAPVGS